MRVHALLCLLIWSVPVQCQWQLVVGGSYTVEIFPPPSSDTCSIPDLPGPREYHSLSLLSGGRLVVCGGLSTSEEKSCVAWTRGSTSWTHLHNTSTARSGHVAWTPTSLPNSIVLLGGRDAEIVPCFEKWSSFHLFLQVEEPLNCITVDTKPAGFP